MSYDGYCPQFCKDFGLEEIPCCDSCHEDELIGYEMIEKNVNNKSYYICCNLSNAYNNKFKLDE